MDTNDNLKRIVEYKKLKGSIRKPKYATRKLSIGLVSCMLGYALLVSPSSVEASAETTDQVAEEKATSPEEDLVEESSEVTDEAKEEPVTYNEENLDNLPVSDILEGDKTEETPALEDIIDVTADPSKPTPEGTAITKDNATITATATKVGEETSAKPVIKDVIVGDTKITGTGVPGSTIVVTQGKFTIGTTTVNDDGTWSVDVKRKLSKGQKIRVKQTETGKKPAYAETTVREKTSEADKTTVDKGEDTTFSPDGTKQDTKIVITNPDEDTKVVAKDKNGNNVETEIGEDGKVYITPSKEAAGPITVTVTDKNLADPIVKEIKQVEQGDSCLTKEELQKQFEDASDKMFGKIGEKEGIYKGEYNKENKNVTVYILDKDQDAKALSGTGLIDGLIELYNNNKLTKVQIGNGKVLDLKKLEKEAPGSGMTFAQILKLTIGAGMLEEVQNPNNQSGNLSDFINKTVHLHLTLHQEGCEEAGDVNLTYTINGVDGNDKEAPAAPGVVANGDGSVTVTPPADEDTKTVEVTYTPEGKDTLETVVVTKGEDGKWTLPEGSNLTVDPETGVVTIPADQVKDDTEVTAIAKDNAGNKSKEGIATAGKNPVVETTEAPKINQPKAFDTTVTGTATPGATVEVTLPNGDKKTTTADEKGNWTVETPKLEKDAKITAKATEENKKPSEDTTQTVSSWQSLFDAKTEDLEVTRGTDVKAHDVYEKVKLIFKENGKEFVVGEDNRILLPIGNDSHAWLEVDSSKLPTKDSAVGKYTQNVTINYPDGSKEIVQVVVRVKDSNADKYEPTGKDITVKKGEMPKAEDAITNKDKLPKGTKYTWKETPDTTTDGTKDAVVVVTYPDGSIDEVPVKVNVTIDGSIITPIPTVEAEAETVDFGGKYDLTDNIKDLPEGATVEDVTPKGEINVNQSGNYTGKVKITFKDGSTRVVEVPVVVKEQNESSIPEVNQVTEGDDKITGKGTPGSDIVVTDEDGNEIGRTKVGEDGSWEVKVPEGKELQPEDKLTVTQTEKDKKPSDATTTVTEKEKPAQEYLLVFNGNGGSPSSQRAKVKDGEKVEGIEEPTREGYKFVKWAILGTDNTFDINANFNKDILAEGDNSLMLVAVWEKIDYKTTADKVDPNLPEKTEVGNKDKLTEDEKNTVKDKIEKANKDKFPEGTKVDVDEKGNATITYPDGSKDTIPAKDLVTEKPSDDKTTADKVDPNLPEKTEVGNKDKLTEDEKNTVKDKIEKANKDKFPEGTKVDVDDKGNATITYPDGSKDTIPAKDLVTEKDKGTSKPDLNDSEKNVVVTPKDKTGVVDKNNLTDKERAEIADKVKKANPEVKEVVVDKKGNATLIYKDGSKNTIPADKLVYEIGKVKVPSQQTNNKDNKSGSASKAKKNSNVKTGVESLAGVAATLAAAASGIFATRKKKEDEE